MSFIHYLFFAGWGVIIIGIFTLDWFKVVFGVIIILGLFIYDREGRKDAIENPIFGVKRYFKKVADNLVDPLKRQLKSASKNREINWTKEKIGFTSGYLMGFVYEELERFDCTDSVLKRKLLKRVCNKIARRHLWDLFTNGEHWYDYDDMTGKSKYSEANNMFEIGEDIGRYEASKLHMPINSEKLVESMMKVVPISWAIYLSTESIDNDTKKMANVYVKACQIITEKL